MGLGKRAPMTSACNAPRATGISHYAFLWVFLVILLFIFIFASFWAYNRYIVRRNESRENTSHG